MSEASGPKNVWEWLRLVVASDMDYGAKHVCHALALHLNKKLEAWPSPEVLAQEMSVSPRSVRRYHKEADDAGFLEREKIGPRKYLYRAVIPSELMKAREWTFGDVAPEVRRCWWLDPTPPDEDWNMGRERSVLREFAEKHGWEVVCAAVPLVRGQFDMNGEPFTGRLVKAKKNRARWERCLTKAEEALVEQSPVRHSAGNTVAEILEGVDL